MFLARFEPAVPASKRPHTHTLDRAATRIGSYLVSYIVDQLVSELVSHPASQTVS
jgi:hypothetical protein